MEIDIRDEQKIVEVWLSKAERDDPGLAESLRQIYAAYRQRNYTVAVFKSGEGDLFELTSGLLTTNRRKLAEQEVENERATGPSMTMGM